MSRERDFFFHSSSPLSPWNGVGGAEGDKGPLCEGPRVSAAWQEASRHRRHPARSSKWRGSPGPRRGWRSLALPGRHRQLCFPCRCRGPPAPPAGGNGAQEGGGEPRTGPCLPRPSRPRRTARGTALPPRSRPAAPGLALLPPARPGSWRGGRGRWSLPQGMAGAAEAKARCLSGWKGWAEGRALEAGGAGAPMPLPEPPGREPAPEVRAPPRGFEPPLPGVQPDSAGSPGDGWPLERGEMPPPPR